MEMSREVNTCTPVSVTLVCAETSIGDPWWQKSIPPSRLNEMLEGCKLFGLKKNCEDCQRQIKVWKFCHKRWLLERQQLWLDMFMNKFFFWADSRKQIHGNNSWSSWDLNPRPDLMITGQILTTKQLGSLAEWRKTLLKGPSQIPTDSHSLRARLEP